MKIDTLCKNVFVGQTRLCIILGLLNYILKEKDREKGE